MLNPGDLQLNAIIWEGGFENVSCAYNFEFKACTILRQVDITEMLSFVIKACVQFAVLYYCVVV